MHSLFILPIATYMVLAACLIWNSPNRNLEFQGIAEGGGRQDTMV
jgi:membrane protein involved in colicin uptake